MSAFARLSRMGGTMNSRANAVFSRALEVPEPVRQAFLVRICGDDRELETEVRGMLKDAERADRFFNEARENPENGQADSSRGD